MLQKGNGLLQKNAREPELAHLLIQGRDYAEFALFLLKQRPATHARKKHPKKTEVNHADKKVESRKKKQVERRRRWTSRKNRVDENSCGGFRDSLIDRT